MKKTAVLLLAGALCAALLSGCGKKEETAEPEISLAAVENVVEQKEEPPAHEGEARSALTGEWIDEEAAALRPFAVMMGNTKIATPQYGISSADVIYESPVEGSETRLMPIFQDYRSVEKICSVRSCRLYYIDWALEFDAIYGHYGQAYLAKDMLAEDYVNNLSGLSGALENTMYFRDPDRKAPHNAYTTGEGISEGIRIMEYDPQREAGYESHYRFNEDDENEQVCDWYVADEEAGYLSIDTMSGGSGYYITNGKAVPVTWSKESQSAPTRYYDADGNEITLNQGKTWVCIIQDTYADRVAFYASEEEFQTAQ